MPTTWKLQFDASSRTKWWIWVSIFSKEWCSHCCRHVVNFFRGRWPKKSLEKEHKVFKGQFLWNLWRCARDSRHVLWTRNGLGTIADFKSTSQVKATKPWQDPRKLMIPDRLRKCILTTESSSNTEQTLPRWSLVSHQWKLNIHGYRIPFSHAVLHRSWLDPQEGASQNTRSEICGLFWYTVSPEYHWSMNILQMEDPSIDYQNWLICIHGNVVAVGRNNAKSKIDTCRAPIGSISHFVYQNFKSIWCDPLIDINYKAW